MSTIKTDEQPDPYAVYKDYLDIKGEYSRGIATPKRVADLIDRADRLEEKLDGVLEVLNRILVEIRSRS